MVDIIVVPRQLHRRLSFPPFLKAVSGEKDNTLQTLGGEDVDLDIKCTVGHQILHYTESHTLLP